MKQFIKFLAVAFAFAATVSACQKAEIGAPADKNLKTVTITAQLPDTKADIQADGKVFWQEGDQIAVYVEGTKYELALVAGAGTKAGIFSGEVAEGTIANAIYPASAAKAAYAAPTVPTTQVIPAGASCDPAAVVMDGEIAEGAIAFKNVAGGVQVTLPEGAQRVTLVSGGNTVTATVPGKGVYNVMLPTATFNGFTVAVATADSHSFLSTDKTLEVTASKIFRLSDITTGAKVVPNTLTTTQQFLDWAENAEYYVKGETVTVAADIDLSEGGELRTWKPITYAGNLEGAKKDINDLYVIKGYQVKASEQELKSDDYMYVGFFGYLSGGLKYLQFGTKGGHDAVVIADACNVDASYHVNIGGVIGRTKYGWVEGVKSCAEITMTEGANYKYRIGGITGHFQSANSTADAKYSMLDCVFDGSILIDGKTPANTSYAGGMVGYSQANIFIRSCTNLGSIKVTSEHLYQTQVGGIIGQLGSKGNGPNAVISNCCNGSAFDAEAPMLLEVSLGGCYKKDTSYKYLGGIAGACYATIDHCFNYANIGFTYATKECGSNFNGGKASPRIGGICAYLTTDQPLTMTNCANFGNIYNGFVNNTRTNVGNLIGYGQKSTGVIKNCLCAGNCLTEGSKFDNDGKSTQFRAGVIVGCQAATATYGTVDEPILVLNGLQIITSYSDEAKRDVTYTVNDGNYTNADILDGKTAAGNVYNVALVNTVEEGLAKLVDRYAE